MATIYMRTDGTPAGKTNHDRLSGEAIPSVVAANDRSVVLSTLPAGLRQRRVALAAVALSTLGFFAAVPFVRIAPPQIPAFIPAYEAALAINDLITAVLLIGQFAQLRSRALLVLAAGYLFDALIIVPHMLTFPAVFSPTGLLGAGSQTTAWLYVFWHGGFALFALAYALLARPGDRAGVVRMRPRLAIAWTIGAVIAITLALTAVTTIGHDYLPEIIRAGDYSLLVTKGVSPTIWVISLLALLAMLRRGRPSMLDLWLMVVLCAWLYDVALSAVISSNRFDLGYYAGRCYGLLASGFVLVVLLLETNGLHRGLAVANSELEAHGRELEERVRRRTVELGRSNDALKTEIAERKQAEARLVQAQKMEAIGNLTGGMAHDFNNLLGIIIGNLDLLRGLDPGASGAEELTNDALDAALRGADLTRRLLAFARQQPLKPERVDANELIAGITKLLRRTLGENIEISLDLAGDLWPVTVDPAQLEASLANLATNARDAMPKGGRLMIATRNYDLDPDYALAHDVQPGDYVKIEVTDSGTGMPPELLTRIFEPFFTTKQRGKGTGLGLSMVFGFIKQSLGHINVYSELGAGTTFRLYLPRDAAEAEAVQPQARAAVAGGTGEWVLAVEDNAALRRIVMRQLADLGYCAVEADSAAAALAILERQKIDAIFTDIVMPGEVDGFALAQQVVARWPGVKVLLTSGFPEAKLNDQLGALGPSARLLSKPYRKDELARTLRDILDTRAALPPR